MVSLAIRMRLDFHSQLTSKGIGAVGQGFYSHWNADTKWISITRDSLLNAIFDCGQHRERRGQSVEAKLMFLSAL